MDKNLPHSEQGMTGDPGAEIVALIARLEKATGPDRKLDGEIFARLGGHAWDDARRRVAEPSGAPPALIDHDARQFAPLYTFSIDAALTLVPDFINRRWYMADSDHKSDGKAVAAVYHPADILNGIPRSVGATPAIALCIAALTTPSTERSPDTIDPSNAEDVVKNHSPIKAPET